MLTSLYPHPAPNDSDLNLQCVGLFFIAISDCPIPDGCPPVQLKSDTVYMEITSGTQAKSSVLQECPPHFRR